MRPFQYQSRAQSKPTALLHECSVKRHRQAGFTLIELLVVIIIIGILAGLVNGATLLAGSVLIAYLASLNLYKNLFVASIALM